MAAQAQANNQKKQLTNNQADIYKVYLNYMPEGSKHNNNDRGTGTPGKRASTQMQPSTNQNVVMKNRQNVLKQVNQLKQNSKITADTNGSNQLPMIQQ